MSTQIDRREIEIPWNHAVFDELASIINENFREDDHAWRRVTKLTGDRENLQMSVHVPSPRVVAAEFERVLAEADLKRVPDDPEDFAVASINVQVESISTVTIEVYA